MTMRHNTQVKSILRGSALRLALCAGVAAATSSALLAYPSAPPVARDSGAIIKVAAARSASAAQVQEAIDLAQKQSFDAAFAAARKSGDPVLGKIVEWYYVQSPTAKAGFGRIFAFSSANPTWPNIETVDARGELALYLGAPEPATVIGHFAKAPPRTGAGGIALARAHLALGDRNKAREWIRRTWRGFDLSESMEKTVVKEMGGLIDSADHRHRLALMIYRHQAKAAARAAAYLPKSYQAMARAAAAYLRRSKSAGTLFYKLPVSLQNDPAITYV